MPPSTTDPQSDPRNFPFPPSIPIAGWLLGWVLGRIWPTQLAWPAWTRWAGWFLFVVPWSLAVCAMVTFRRHSTPVLAVRLKIAGIADMARRRRDRKGEAGKLSFH